MVQKTGEEYGEYLTDMNKTKNKKVIALLDEWMADKSGYDEYAYPIIERNRRVEEGCLIDNLPKIQVTSRLAIDDISLIANGSYAPLAGFMNYNQYRSVLEDMHLPDGTPWTMPITLPVSSEDIYSQDIVDLYDGHKFLATMNVTDVYPYSPLEEAHLVYGTDDANHPGVANLYKYSDGYVLLGGTILVETRDVQNESMLVRSEFKTRGWKTIAAFQTRNPMHRAHEYITKCALELCDGLFIHPLVGELKADDVPQSIRMKCYQTLIENYYPYNRVAFAGLPMGMRYAGPREAVHHAIVRKNFGCTHFIVGRDAAGVGNYYKPYEAWDLFDKIGNLGITPLFFHDVFYCKKCGSMATEKTCPHNEKMTLSGTQVRQMLKDDEPLPPEITRWEVYEILKGAYS